MSEEHNQHLVLAIAIPSDGPNEKNVFMLEKTIKENYQEMNTWIFRQSITHFIPMHPFIPMLSSAYQ